MRTKTIQVREGENVGPIDWSHPMAKEMPQTWHEAESSPNDFTIDYGQGSREILAICMYDGWPYWKPTPAVNYVGPLGWSEWAFFDSYGVNKDSISRKATGAGTAQK